MTDPIRPLDILRHLAMAVFIGAGGYNWYLAARLQFCSTEDVFMKPMFFLLLGYLYFMAALLASHRKATPAWIRRLLFGIAAFCPSLLASWILLLVGTEWLRDCYIDGVPQWNMLANLILAILFSLSSAIWLAWRQTRPVPAAPPASNA